MQSIVWNICEAIRTNLQFNRIQSGERNVGRARKKNEVSERMGDWEWETKKGMVLSYFANNVSDLDTLFYQYHALMK